MTTDEEQLVLGSRHILHVQANEPAHLVGSIMQEHELRKEERPLQGVDRLDEGGHACLNHHTARPLP